MGHAFDESLTKGRFLQRSIGCKFESIYERAMEGQIGKSNKVHTKAPPPAGQPFALRSENGVEVTGSPSELRWPLVCVGVVMGPSLPRFMILW